jgi:hypothetical protein
VSYFLLASVSSRLAWPKFPSRRRSCQVSSFVVALCVQQPRVYVAPALLSTSLAVAQLASSSCRVVYRYSLPAGLAVDHVQVIVRLLASRLFNKTPKSIDCRRTAAIHGCQCHLRQLARPTTPYTSPFCVVVDPCIIKKSQESGEDKASSAITKRSTNCLDRKIATDLADSCQLWKR